MATAGAQPPLEYLQVPHPHHRQKSSYWSLSILGRHPGQQTPLPRVQTGPAEPCGE